MGLYGIILLAMGKMASVRDGRSAVEPGVAVRACVPVSYRCVRREWPSDLCMTSASASTGP